jgi:predicted nucleotidyltransferase component of viral defense system
MKKEIVNIPASIRQKLINLANLTNQPFNQLKYIYANERFLYRFGLSPYKSNFVLKGAMAVLNLALEHPRYTRDIDFLGFTENSVQNVEDIIREICRIEFKEDGLVFDVSSVRGAPIKETDEYSGVRVNFDAFLGDSKIPNLQVDIGVGDAVYPQPKEADYKGLLDLPKASIRVYPLEAILSEKIHSLEKYGLFSSRMKDIYDIWRIADNQKIDGETFSEALRSTFNNRQTSFPVSLILFDKEYLDQRKINAWNGVGKKLQSVEYLPDLALVINQLRKFLMPIMESLYQDKEFSLIWDPSKDWGWQ